MLELADGGNKKKGELADMTKTATYDKVVIF